MSAHSPFVLLILDGFGYSNKMSHNAIAKASTPQWDDWWQHRPHMLLQASGEAVGLPDKQMGNSEVGHMHIGAGRKIDQDFTRINQAISRGQLAHNHTLLQMMNTLQQSGKTLHIFGLLSPGGVHSHENHLFEFLKYCQTDASQPIALHLFLDGRDTPPQSAIESIQRLNRVLNNLPNARIASIAGRYFALDRDQRWNRIEPVYRLMTEGISELSFDTALLAIEYYYQQGIFDEFIPPTRIGRASCIEDHDQVFFFNFRADRARELTEAFLAKDFQAFHRTKHPQLNQFVSMTQYADYLPTEPLFPPLRLKDTLGEVLSKHQLSQLRIAETEKYAHVTFFLNGGIETVFPGEERVLIPSPKVSTYNLKPEMSAPLITQAILHAIHHRTHDVIICNYANADMVGHTGDFEATCEAITYLDKALHQIGQALESVNGQLLITADHGNAECMYNELIDQPHTAHTTNLVPLLYVGNKHWTFDAHQKGSLIDIAPTMLTLLNIKPPATMTGRALLTNDARP